MMRKIKKVLGAVLLSAMIFNITGNASALASNWADTSYNIIFNNSTKYTNAIKVSDCEGIYVKCNSITNNASFTAHVVGCKTATSTGCADCSRGHTYTFRTAGQSYFITNFARENRYNYVRLALAPDYGYMFLASIIVSVDKYE